MYLNSCVWSISFIGGILQAEKTITGLPLLSSPLTKHIIVIYEIESFGDKLTFKSKLLQNSLTLVYRLIYHVTMEMWWLVHQSFYWKVGCSSLDSTLVYKWASAT